MQTASKLKVSILASALFATVAVAQVSETRHDRIYVDRERTASPAIRAVLLQHRTRLAAEKRTFTVGYTFALDHKLEEITGGRKIQDASVVREQNKLSEKLLVSEKARMEKAVLLNPALRLKIGFFQPAYPKVTSKSADFRALGFVSPVRQQKGGTCWVYAAVGALEASSLIVNKQAIDASEHFVITNDTAGYQTPGDWNGGGYCFKAVDFMTNKPVVGGGTVAEVKDPDDGTQGQPNPNAHRDYGSSVWGFCHGTNGQATVEEIKQAMVDHGPVATWIDVSGTFGAYTSGVYDDPVVAAKPAGHFVLIVGWDDNKGAWLIKNSWGTNWGDACGFGAERGFAWVKYGIHGIGTDAVWLHAHANWY